jgi:hypothetical protein
MCMKRDIIIVAPQRKRKGLILAGEVGYKCRKARLGRLSLFHVKRSRPAILSSFT